MKSQAKEILITTVLVIVGLYFLIKGLTAASTFLAPLTIALIIAMVLIAPTRKMEKWGLSRAWSSLVSVLLSLIVVGTILGLLSVQIKSVAEDWPRIKKNMKPGVESVQSSIKDLTGLTADEQVAFMQANVPFASEEKSDSSSKSTTQEEARKSLESRASQNAVKQSSKSESKKSTHKVSSGTIGIVGEAIVGVFRGMGTFLLIFIYIFFLLFYRRKIKMSILKFYPERQRDEAKQVLSQSIKLSEQYLLGRLLLITFLAIIYGVGLSIIGIKNALFISVFAALLSLIPYVGNIVGFFLAIAMAAFTGGGLGMYIGVMVTFGVAQFIESYILEPYVVGEKVDLNPLVTILVVVIGGSVWGVAGMIISIPIFGILKIISDHVPALHPIGYALGEGQEGEDNSDGLLAKLGKKITRLWKK